MAKTGEIVGLQYLRGIAAMGVVLDHASGMATLPKYFGTTVAPGVLYVGSIGVDLFFLISGFIISIVSLRRDMLAPATGMARFFERRFARIVPLMWLAVLSYAGLRWLGRTTPAPGPVIAALTLWPIGPVEPDVIWTLRHEFLFYGLFALSFLGARRKIWLIGAWIAAPIVALILEPVVGVADTGQPLGQLLHFLTYPVNLEFGAGLAIGLWWLRRKEGFMIRLPIEPLLVLASLFGLMVVVAWALDYHIGHFWSVVPAILMAAPLLILGILTHCPEGVAQRFGLLLGNASYAIYLFHLHILSALLGIWSHHAHGSPPALVLGGLVMAAMLGGIIIHLLVEKPLVRLVQQYVVHRPKPSVGV